eukprot:m.71235 g.71235  ORF g.71235 m.71235 type:complete len:69 (+) comp12288_c2_seq1:543-749(+)
MQKVLLLLIEQGNRSPRSQKEALTQPLHRFVQVVFQPILSYPSSVLESFDKPGKCTQANTHTHTQSGN